jgi:hypothetical protein
MIIASAPFICIVLPAVTDTLQNPPAQPAQYASAKTKSWLRTLTLDFEVAFVGIVVSEFAFSQNAPDLFDGECFPLEEFV